MPDQITAEERKARRAEINRQNAKKSTGPKTDAGKATSRLNGLRNGTRAVIIDLGGSPGLALLTGEDPNEYREMVAEYHRAIGPNGRAEVSIVQRIIDAQWRLLRNSRLQTLELEAGLEEVRQTEYPGLPESAVAMLDLIGANRLVVDAKYTERLQREEASLLRVISASYRELNQLRKLNPQPKPPVRRRIEYIGDHTSVLAETVESMEKATPELVESKAQPNPKANDRSQLEAAWLPLFERPAQAIAIAEMPPEAPPLTRTAGAGSA